MVDNRTFFSSKGIIQQAPLYIYPDKSEKKKKLLSQILMFEPSVDYGTRKPNISIEILKELESYYKKQPTPEEILFYIYGIFYSNVYREKYFEFLKIDFPRVPFTKNFKLFKKMADYGEELVNLHIMKSKLLDNPISKYRRKDLTDRIEKINYDEKEKRIYINKEKYFDNIEPEYWNYYIGGYKVLEKYLKERKGRVMEEPRFYCRLITVIHYTIKIQKEIDSIYDKVEAEAGT
jgi:predicted helicase